MKIKELLATPDKWTQETTWANDKGVTSRMGLEEKDATCFCLFGALEHCYKNSLEYEHVEKSLLNEVTNYIKWNDAPERTHAEVLELVTRLDI